MAPNQQPGALLEPDPVVAELFRFAPVLVAGNAWPLLAAEMLVEGLVVQEGRPLTPGPSGFPGSAAQEGRRSSNPRPRPLVCQPPGRWRRVGRVQAGLPGVAALVVGVVVVEAPPVAPIAAPLGLGRERKAGAAEKRNGRKQGKPLSDLNHVFDSLYFPVPIQRRAAAVCSSMQDRSVRRVERCVRSQPFHRTIRRC